MKRAAAIGTDWIWRVWMFYLFYRYWHFGLSELGLTLPFAVLFAGRNVAKAIKEKTPWSQTW
jgi:hypothetical protein